MSTLKPQELTALLVCTNSDYVQAAQREVTANHERDDRDLQLALTALHLAGAISLGLWAAAKRRKHEQGT